MEYAKHIIIDRSRTPDDEPDEGILYVAIVTHPKLHGEDAERLYGAIVDAVTAVAGDDAKYHKVPPRLGGDFRVHDTGLVLRTADRPGLQRPPDGGDAQAEGRHSAGDRDRHAGAMTSTAGEGGRPKGRRNIRREWRDAGLCMDCGARAGKAMDRAMEVNKRLAEGRGLPGEYHLVRRGTWKRGDPPPTLARLTTMGYCIKCLRRRQRVQETE